MFLFWMMIVTTKVMKIMIQSDPEHYKGGYDWHVPFKGLNPYKEEEEQRQLLNKIHGHFQAKEALDYALDPRIPIHQKFAKFSHDKEKTYTVDLTKGGLWNDWSGVFYE